MVILQSGVRFIKEIILSLIHILIAPGLRVGYLAAHKALLRKCVIGKQSSDVHTPGHSARQPSIPSSCCL